MNTLKLVTMLAGAALALALSPVHVAAQTEAKPVSLGIQFLVTPEGPEVSAMLPDWTGEAIGFRIGDLLIEAGGKPISEEVLKGYLKEKKEGDQLSFKVKRANAVIELTGKAIAVPEGVQPLTGQPQ